MVELRDISFTYEEGMQENGLSHLNLSIKEGEVVVLCGISGCGKTTITRLINGLIPHYYKGSLSGEIFIHNINLKTMAFHEIAWYVGSVFQNPRSQFYCVDTNSELAFACENFGLPVEEILKRIELTTSQMNMHHLMNRNMFKLSGGEKQQIACGCVHAVSPQIIVLDEPSSNLDPASTAILSKLIVHWKEEGKTVIIAEHRLYYLLDVADRFLYIHKGEISSDMRIEEIKEIKPNQLASLGLRSLFLDALSLEQHNDDPVEEYIEVRNLSVSYKKGNQAMNIPSLSLPKGAIIGVIGYNGAGKTTFAKSLCSLIKKRKGEIFINDFGKTRTLQSYMVMQDVNHQLFTQTVLEEVLLSMEKENEEKALAILDSLHLLEMKDLHPMSLSGGEKQRVAIASALASERELIVFDEITSGLDLFHMIQVSKQIKQIKQLGKTVVIITHDLELILKTCTYIVQLSHGVVEASYHLSEQTKNHILHFFLNHIKS